MLHATFYPVKPQVTSLPACPHTYSCTCLSKFVHAPAPALAPSAKQPVSFMSNMKESQVPVVKYAGKNSMKVHETS